MPRPLFRSRGSEARIEMAPLLDVIFLLLTFFIYSIVLTVRAEVLPVTLPAVATGEVPADAPLAGITVDGEGAIYLNREPVSRAELATRLGEMAEADEQPVVFLALEAGPGPVDRGPMLVDLVDMLRRLGIESFQIVGRPEQE